MGLAFFFSGDVLLLDTVDLVVAVFMDSLLLLPGVCTDETSAASSSPELCAACVLGICSCTVCGVGPEIACAILFAIHCKAVAI